MGAQRHKCGKPQYAGPHLRFSGCAGCRSARFSLLSLCQAASAFRLIYLFHTFFRRGVHRAMVFAPLRRPKLFRFPFACLRAAPSVCFAHRFYSTIERTYSPPLSTGPNLDGTFCSQSSARTCRSNALNVSASHAARPTKRPSTSSSRIYELALLLLTLPPKRIGAPLPTDG